MEPDLSLLKAGVEFVMTGLVVWIVWMMFKSVTPKMFEEFRNQIALERKQCSECSAAIERLSRILLLLVERLGGDVPSDFRPLMNGVHKQATEPESKA